MPFTVAHAAAGLPLKAVLPRRLSLSGLMAGAMAPDLLYFLVMTTVDRGLSHSWPGLFLFCLPAGTAFALAFHGLIKYPLLTNLPSPWDRRFSGLATARFHPHGVRGWSVVVLSVGIGALTHFFWDSFTHPGGELARALPFLQAQVRAFGQVIPVSRIAQHTSTLLGISALLSGSWRGWLLPAPATGARFRTARDKWRFWLGSGLFATLFALAVTWAYRTYWPDRVATTFTTFGLAGWAGFFWVVAVCGAISRFLPGRGRSGPAGDRARQPVGAWRSQS